MGKIAQPLRVALTGTAVSPSIDKTLWLLGRERSLERIRRALEYILTRAAAAS
jgi:glutamyl-tRNA synthetase